MTNDESETPSKMRDFAEKSVETARGAVDTLLNAARATADTIQSTTKTGDTPEGQAVARGFGFAKENITAIFDFAQQLVRAPDLKQAVEMQSDFVRKQATIMEKQVEELRSLTPADATGAAKADATAKPEATAKPDATAKSDTASKAGSVKPDAAPKAATASKADPKKA